MPIQDELTALDLLGAQCVPAIESLTSRIIKILVVKHSQLQSKEIIVFDDFTSEPPSNY